MIKTRSPSLSNGQVIRNGRPISKTNVRSPYPFLLSENSVSILLLSFHPSYFHFTPPIFISTLPLSLRPSPCHFDPPLVTSTLPLSFQPSPCHFDPWEKSRPSESRNNTFQQTTTRISKTETFPHSCFIHAGGWEKRFFAAGSE